MGHAPAAASACPAPANRSLDNTCKRAGYGAEPLCCGAACGTPSCSSALWPGKTRVLFGKGARGGNAGVCAALTIRPDREPRGALCCKKATEAAAAATVAPPTAAAAPALLDASGPGFLSWEGNSLRGIATIATPPANMERWSGGMEGGPLVLYSSAAALAGQVWWSGSVRAGLLDGRAEEAVPDILVALDHGCMGGVCHGGLNVDL